MGANIIMPPVTHLIEFIKPQVSLELQNLYPCNLYVSISVKLGRIMNI